MSKIIGGTVGTTMNPKKLSEQGIPNPNAIAFTGAVSGTYDGSAPLTVNIPEGVTDEHINELINTALGVIENGTY